ncbi:hypothetical protein DFP72DRAFT_1070712 [Ephemerocybe angulata]|uniref:DUF6589 domain-containing protein n=1 Tax=Ephemerocybe angulata TaxID=980116 RepID=A0A8H6HUH9_9AGAR|nr:hypothetical protein DFP72DRAFT_1070712 [Tulosesus angulatus]
MASSTVTTLPIFEDVNLDSHTSGNELEDDERSVSSGYASDTDTDSEEDPTPMEGPDDQAQEQLTPTVVDHYQRTTRAKRYFMKPINIYKACANVVYAMQACGIDLPIFLDALFWGNEFCTKDATMQWQRTVFLRSTELPEILDRWRTPPRSSHSMKRPAGATETMEEFAVQTVTDVAEKELKELGPELRLSSKDDTSASKLTALSFTELEGIARGKAPTLWRLLHAVLDTGQGKKWERTALTILGMISYTQSHNHNRIQKLLAIYLKFRGISAKGFDTLHAMGLTMSHKWTCNAVERMSAECMREVVEKMKAYPWLISYDNINIPFRVFSQRLDNQSKFGNGTAATVYIKRDAPKLPEGINQSLKEKRVEGMANPLTESDIARLATESYPRVQQQMAYIILRMLLDSPEFNLKTYKDRNDPALQPPKPVDQLPTGDDHVTLQYLLGTTSTAEASYQDNSKLIDEWLGQLGWMTPAQKKAFALATLVFWCGDQLTVDRLRHLFMFRGGDDTSYDRMDFSVLLFGWFHLQMAYANSLHKQYLGTERGRGLQHAFDLLNRKGLGKVLTKGPFHHTLDEALHHVAEAHIREDWLDIANVKSLSELRQRSAKELRALASKIVKMRASSEAMDRLDKRGDENDEQLRQVIMWNRDVLQYLVLDEAVKTGDVGLMEKTLPHLYYRFSGSGNSKYAIEVLELMQSLYREWPAEVADFARRHCWLVNTTGKPGKFCPVDMAQEHNIRDIKVTYRSQGPNIQWEYLKKLHPAIHIIRRVTTYIENEFKTIVRGAKHTVPKAELDIKKLQSVYHETGFHSYAKGRKITVETDRAEDYVTEGVMKLNQGKVLEKWREGRSYERSTREDDVHMDVD